MLAKSVLRTLTVAAAVLAIALPVMAAVDEDNGDPGNPLPDAMAEIPSMTGNSIVFDFDLMPQGATTVAAILAAFPDSTVADITFSTCTGSSPGTYDTNPTGRALAADPNGSLGLYLVDAGGGFGCSDDITITFTETITEFGSQVADYNGPLTYTVFDGAANVGTIDLDHTGAAMRYASSTVPFDSLVISTFPSNPAGNYVFPTFEFPEGTAQQQPEATIPTLGSVGIVILIVLLAGIGIVIMRRLF